MKRPRKQLTVHTLPASGRFQLVTIKWSYGPLVKYCSQYRLPPAVLSGLYTIDLDSGRLSSLDTWLMDFNWLEYGTQGPGNPSSGWAEKEVTHICATGTLYEGMDVISLPRTYQYNLGEFGDLLENYQCNWLYTVLADGNVSTHLTVYEFGDYTIKTEIEGGMPILDGQLFHYERLERGEVKSAEDTSLGTILFHSYGDDLGSGMRSVSWDCDLTNVDFRITQQGSVVAHCHDYNYATRLEEVSSPPIYWEVVPLSPVYVKSELGSQEERQLRLNALWASVNADLHACLNERDAQGVWNSCSSCVEQINATTVNGITFLKDLMELKALIEPFVEVWRNKFSPKAWASLLLSLRYGARLTWADMYSLYEAFRKIRRTAGLIRGYALLRNSVKVTRGRDTQTITSDAYTGKQLCCTKLCAQWLVPVDPKDRWETVVTMVDDMGMRLNASNLWDLLPWSFVINWFVNIGKLLSDLDFQADLNRLRIINRVYSTHNTCHTPTTRYLGLGFFGTVNLDTYARRISSDSPEYPWSLGAPSFQKHLWEEALLTVQLL